VFDHHVDAPVCCAHLRLDAAARVLAQRRDPIQFRCHRRLFSRRGIDLKQIESHQAVPPTVAVEFLSLLVAISSI
jgi:hypothetical protein